MTEDDLKRGAYLPLVALTLLAVIWGYNWVVMKVGVRYSDPFTFAALRNGLGALALFGVLALRRGSLRPKVFWWTGLYGFFSTSMSGLSVWALYVGSAGRTSVLTYTMPFWLLLIAWPVLGERIRGLQWAAVMFALAGLVFVLDPWSLRGVKASILAVAGGLAWAVASVIFKIIRRHHEVEILSFTAWSALLGSIPLIVVALIVDREGPVWNGGFVGALLYNVIAASAIAWLLWLFVLNRLPAGTAGISSLAIPVVGVVAAWIQLGERPDAVEAVGMGLILAALAVLTVRGLLGGGQVFRTSRGAGRYGLERLAGSKTDKGATMAESAGFGTEWTGHDLYDLDGNLIGKIEDVRYGDVTGGLQWLVVGTGFAGPKKIFVPAADVRRSGDRLSVRHTKTRVEGAPKLADEEAITQAEEAKLCRFYGLQYAGDTSATAEGCEEMKDVRPAG